MPQRIEFLAVIYFAVVHALAVAAIFLPLRPGWIPLAIALAYTFNLGTCAGLHRLLSHRAFSCPKWVEYALVSAAMVTAQGSPLLWVATHRRHHAHSDRAGDVHSPHRGFWYAHIGWMIDRDSTDSGDSQRYCRDLAEDPYYRWLLRWRFVPQVITILLIGLVLGWAALPFTFFVPLVWWMHITYLVNSACHTQWLGTRSFETRDGSRNVWWVALLTWGEGWHNNHHASPRSARMGLMPGQLDLVYLFIRALGAFGLAWDIQTGAPTQSD